MILDKEVKVLMVGTNYKYYSELGYEKDKDGYANVKIEDLKINSHINVNVECDYCNKKSYIKYQSYNKNTQNGARKYACSSCKNHKYRETCKDKYGYEFATQNPEIKEKTKQTNLERYGVSSHLSCEEVKQKKYETCLEKYGEKYTICIPQAIEKRKERSIELFGAENPFYSSELQDKIHEENIKKYGYSSPAKNAEVYTKIRESMFHNNTCPTSKQQLYLHSLYGGELNYPCKNYAIDILLTEYNIAIEYNGGGHDLNVKLGTISEKEFYRKEIIREKTIKSHGYKIMTITSNHDKLPSDEILLKMLDVAKDYLLNTNHTWIEFDIDNNYYRNAESGVSIFDYGELRKIKTNKAS